MRSLMMAGLAIGLALPASLPAQGEVIIRRPGQPDRVIPLDQSGTTRAVLELQGTMDSLRRRVMLKNRSAFDSVRGALRSQTITIQLDTALRSREREMAIAGRHLEAAQRQLNARVLTGNLDSVLASTREEIALTNRAPEIMLENRDALDRALTATGRASSALTRADVQRALAAAKESAAATTALARRESEVARRVAAAARQDQHPRLGVVLEFGPRESDKYGVYVTAVTPGGPAAQAGVRAGDIITTLAGRSLAVTEREERGRRDESSPAIKLTQVLAQLTPGKSVNLGLRRDDKTLTVRITPDDSDDDESRDPFDRGRGGWVRGEPATATVPPMRVFGGEAMPSGSINYFFGSGAARLFSNLELAALNPDLGSYFGASNGVLVVSVNRVVPVRWSIFADTVRLRRGDSTGKPSRGQRADTVALVEPLASTTNRTPSLDLKPGDVITAVDGREVTTPSQLMRVVGSYASGESFKLQILRQKRAQTVDVTVP